jgi:hypothetical protein
MWCNVCHFGGASYSVEVGKKCPQCGRGSIVQHKNPFDKKPTGMGSGRKFHPEEEDDDSPKVEKIVKTTKIVE